MTYNDFQPNKQYQVTVIVASYNPDRNKLKRTIYSAVNQVNIDLQLIVADDGSQNNSFCEVERLLSKLNFNNFELISAKTNQGTVNNIYMALMRAKGEFIKLLSPGDYLYKPDTLFKWYNYCKLNNYSLSFGNAIYYCEKNGKLHYVKDATHPEILRIYKSKPNVDTIRKYYVVYENITLGAATLCRIDLMKSYMSEIVGKVIYAEDNIYRIMHADGIVQRCYNAPVIWYEANTGISRKKSDIWKERLMKDFCITDQIIVDRPAKDKLEYKMQQVLKQARGSNRRRLIKMVYFPGAFANKVERIIGKKWHMSPQTADERFYYETQEYVNRDNNV